ncbi:uncharacterized protein LOC144927283 [Branchiostoma floridae x Branchiostoma belcheri]
MFERENEHLLTGRVRTRKWRLSWRGVGTLLLMRQLSSIASLPTTASCPGMSRVYSWAAKQLTPACCPDQVMRRRVESLLQGRFIEFKGQLSNMALQLTPASCPDMSR